MKLETLRNLRSWPDAKLRCAKIHLDELRIRATNGSTDFDRAFQESFLFHLLGAKDAFLIELNEYYAAGLGPEAVTLGNLWKALKERGVRSQEVAELYNLERSHGGWLFDTKKMRDACTHVNGVAMTFHMGGHNHGKVFLRNPVTKKNVETDVREAFELWLSNMTELIDRLRDSAVETNRCGESTARSVKGGPNGAD